MDTGAFPGAFRRLAVRHPGLRIALLHGSRGRGDAHQGSDWDVGYLADTDFDHLGLHADLVELLGSDEIDLVDLASASALLRFRAAGEALPLFERVPGDHQAFVLEATLFWCDAGPVIRRAGAAVLADLAR